MYTIIPILNGILTSTKGALTYRVDECVEVAFPVLTFLIRADDPGDDTAILVDTGVNPSGSAYMQEQDRTVGPPGGGPTPLRDGLADHGLVPSDIDTVVLTHLHHDHAANIQLFDTAEFLVQRAELDTARNPLPVFERSYPSDTISALSDTAVTLLDGDHQLRDGIELMVTPGHSPGMQSVLVDTAAGRHALVGDLAYLRHNLEPDRSTFTDANGRQIAVTSVDADYIPPGTHTDVPACYDSMARIRQAIATPGAIIPSHDPTVVGRSYPASN